MNKLFLLPVLALAGISAYAQDDVRDAAMEAASAIMNAPKPEEVVAKPQYWATSADFDLGFNQTALFNWAAGGNNTITLGVGLDAKANYAKDLASWNNRLQLNYGFLWSSDKHGLLQKNNDRIYLESKYAMKFKEDSKWNYTAALDFRTQFTDGFKDSGWEEVDGQWVGQKISGFFSPAYLNLALGIEWVPNDWFTLNIAPATGGLVFCNAADLRSSYGMKPIAGTTPTLYNSSLFQLGAQVKADVKVSINEKFAFETQLVLFYDYLYDYKAENASKFPIRVNWDNKISWQAARFFKIALNTWMIYDPIVVFMDEGQTVGDHRVQFKEFFSISFSYAISNKKK
ncbi:MAG: DUF3078 domain-containing protein [Bacteroidia bacterium]|nr:DUF3078 domain-containing protein [Bacteroidia bacterium]